MNIILIIAVVAIAVASILLAWALYLTVDIKDTLKRAAIKVMRLLLGVSILLLIATICFSLLADSYKSIYYIFGVVAGTFSFMSFMVFHALRKKY